MKNGWDYEIRNENKLLRARFDSVVVASHIPNKYTDCRAAENNQSKSEKKDSIRVVEQSSVVLTSSATPTTTLKKSN